MPKIDRQGVYQIDAAAYHDDPTIEPSLSASIASVLLSHSPAHAREKHPRLNPDFEAEEKPHFDLGTAAHHMALRQDFWREEIEVVNAASWQTKAARERRDKAREASRTPVLIDHYKRLDRMVSALEAHPQARRAFLKGKPEQTLVWRDPATGAWMRCRPDWMPDDVNDPWPDYKSTTDARPKQWDRRFLLDHGGLMRAAMYEEGIRQVFHMKHPTLYYVVQEVAPPFAISCRIMSSDSEAMKIGRAMLRKATHLWAECSRTGEWSGYEPTGTIQMPHWSEVDMAATYSEWMVKGDDPADPREDLTKAVIP